MDEETPEPEIVAVQRDSNTPVEGNAAILAQNVQITGGQFSSAGRDFIVHNHLHNHIDEAPKATLFAQLEAISNFRGVQQDTLSKRAAKTGEWIFDHDVFPKWREPKSEVKTIWGFGIPGAGKTVLTAIVIDYFEILARQEPSSICVGYIYVRYNDNKGLTIRHCLEVLVKQTVEKHPTCRELASKIYAEHLGMETRPTEEELLHLLRRFTTMVAATFYFLDALDEAPVQIQLDLLKALSSLGAKLFITSRPLKLLEAQFPDAHTFEITSQDRDLELHIHKEIDRSPELSRIMLEATIAWREEMVATIKRNCGGMFLHASLQLAALQECLSIRDVEATLTSFPPRIEDVYRDTWKRITDQQGRKGVQSQTCLLWVLGATRSMTVEQLRYAAATSLETHEFDPGHLVPIDALVGSTRGLLVVDKRTQIVRLVHSTAKDILERFIRRTSPHLFSLLASFCITSLVNHGFQRWKQSSGKAWTSDPWKSDLERALEADRLLPYAYHSWSTHAHNALNNPKTFKLVKRFVKGCRAFPVTIPGDTRISLLGPLHVAASFDLPLATAGSARIRVVGPNSKTRDEETPLHFACRNESCSAASELLSLPRTDVNVANKFKQTPLSLALRTGNEVLVRLLLARPAIRLDLIDGKEGWTALHEAVCLGHEGIAKLLLAACPDHVHSVGPYGSTPLTIAARNGRERIVKLLLAVSQREVSSTRAGETPLSLASEGGHEGTVKLLLGVSQGEVHVPNSDRETPLHLASQSGHEGVVKLLLAVSEDEVHLPNAEGSTPLSLAAKGSHEGTVRLLLVVSRDEVHVDDKWGLTPLSWASRGGFEGIVRLLLSISEQEVHMVDRSGQSPLGLACQHGHEGIAKLLLAISHDEAHAVNGSGLTPLAWASKGGHEGIVRILLAITPDKVHLADKHGRTPLGLASQYGHKGVAKVLLATSQKEVHAVDGSGLTPLAWASTGGHEEIVELLLAISQDEVRLTDTSGFTPLSRASECGHEGTVRLLLSASQTELHVVDHFGRTPLSWASGSFTSPRPSSNNAAVVELILPLSEKELNLGDKDGLTPLIWALRGEYPRTCEILLNDPKLDVNLPDHTGSTPLIWAVKEDRRDLAARLLSHPNIDVNLADACGRTPLFWSSHLNSPTIAELLISHPQTDVNFSDDQGETALIAAAKADADDIVRLLLAHPAIDPSLRDSSGRRASEWAFETGQKVILGKLPRVGHSKIIAKYGRRVAQHFKLALFHLRIGLFLAIYWWKLTPEQRSVLLRFQLYRDDSTSMSSPSEHIIFTDLWSLEHSRDLSEGS